MKKLIFLKTKKKVYKIFFIKFKKLLFIIVIVILNILIKTKLINPSNYYSCLTAKLQISCIENNKHQLKNCFDSKYITF